MTVYFGGERALMKQDKKEQVMFFISALDSLIFFKVILLKIFTCCWFQIIEKYYVITSKNIIYRCLSIKEDYF